MNDWLSDNFTRDFKLLISSANGFRKEFPMKKNLGLSGWELNVTKEDLNALPKIKMELEAEITGIRGFNEIHSQKFALPVSLPGTWVVDPKSEKDFSVGGRRAIVLKNTLGSCNCLQAVVYKPSFGGQFVFEVGNRKNELTFSEDRKEAYFEIDTREFLPGEGQLELRQQGGEITTLKINLFPLPPSISDFKISKGDRTAILNGSGLEQIRAIKINGKRAIIEANKQVNPANAAEKMFVFENPNTRQDSNSISLELELENNRIYQYPKSFNVSLARPTLVTNAAKEIEGIAITNPAVTNDKSNSDNNKPNRTSVTNTMPQFDLSPLSVFSVDAAEISVNVQNALTDYNFTIENINIETRIENSQMTPEQLPKPDFEVLDWKTLKIEFRLNEQLRRVLGGKRLQFRIRDKIRGDSDWFTVRKTFARIPRIILVKCAGPGEACELRGEGIDYIGEVSVDGGENWYKNDSTGLIIQPTSDGQRALMIPFYSNKKLLQIKLRDFPKFGGLSLNDYIFLNSSGKKN